MALTGQLLGGPYDKAIVTAEVPIIPVNTVTELALEGDLAKSLILRVKGEYVWQVKGEYFLWRETHKNFTDCRATK